jgi:hypothetical protein
MNVLQQVLIAVSQEAQLKCNCSQTGAASSDLIEDWHSPEMLECWNPPTIRTKDTKQNPWSIMQLCSSDPCPTALNSTMVLPNA